MAKKAKVYLGLSWIVSLILAIFPLTNVILGIVTRVQRGNILWAVLGWSILWILDLVTTLVLGKPILTDPL